MAKLSKRVRAFREKVDANHSYPVDEAVALLKEFGTAKFNETVEVATSTVSLNFAVPNSFSSATASSTG